MKPGILSLTLAFVSFIQISASAQSTQKEISEKIQQVENNLFPNIYTQSDTPKTIAQRLAYYKARGVSVAVIHNYKVEWAKGYGWADDSLKRPVTVHTLFQAGSVSKSLNAVGVLKLVQDKKLDLYADINNYLTSWKFPYDSLSKGKKITIANLLSHTAGLTVHGFPGYAHGESIPTVVEVLNGQKPVNTPKVRSMYQPGLKYEYSGGGTTISQLIVMDITHQPYDKYMYTQVLKPLGMTSSTYTQPPVNIPPNLLATGYYDNGKQIPGKFQIYPEQAAAGLWTNPTDLSKYIIETQLAYQGKSKKVLDQQMTRLRLTPYIDKSAAFGVFIDNLDGVKYFQHQGSDQGFQTQYYGSFEGGNGVVVMVNSDNGAIMYEIINSVAKVYGFKGLNRSKLKKTVTVADSILQSYTGEYELGPKATLTISREGNQLLAKPGKQDKSPLFPETQNKFFVKFAEIEIEFIKDETGKISKAILYQNGAHELKKIK
jgi:CubicO group peptidase (beta-lactamase class C family)